jgi:CRP-like cAMP-binding protein
MSRDRKIIQNDILLAMTDTEFQSIRPHLQHVVLSSPTSLCEPEELFKFAYFPNDGVISIVVVLSDGKTVEAGLIGREGVAGLPAIEGFKRSPLREVVQLSGNAFRIRVSAIRKSLETAPNFVNALKRYGFLFGLQIAQTAACNRLHAIEKRLARWLLMAEDRVHSGTLHITQNFLATMLGTDRSSVSVAAGVLQKLKIIQYRRGTVKVLNRQQLESYACECYQAIQNFDAKDGFLAPRVNDKS